MWMTTTECKLGKVVTSTPTSSKQAALIFMRWIISIIACPGFRGKSDLSILLLLFAKWQRHMGLRASEQACRLTGWSGWTGSSGRGGKSAEVRWRLTALSSHGLIGIKSFRRETEGDSKKTRSLYQKLQGKNIVTCGKREAVFWQKKKSSFSAAWLLFDNEEGFVTQRPGFFKDNNLIRGKNILPQLFSALAVTIEKARVNSNHALSFWKKQSFSELCTSLGEFIFILAKPKILAWKQEKNPKFGRISFFQIALEKITQEKKVLTVNEKNISEPLKSLVKLVAG